MSIVISIISTPNRTAIKSNLYTKTIITHILGDFRNKFHIHILLSVIYHHHHFVFNGGVHAIVYISLVKDNMEEYILRCCIYISNRLLHFFSWSWKIFLFISVMFLQEKTMLFYGIQHTINVFLYMNYKIFIFSCFRWNIIVLL